MTAQTSSAAFITGEPYNRFCECKRPTVARIEVPVGKGKQVHRYDVCAECLEAEREIRKVVKYSQP